jgi:hypothetical protein
MVFFFRHPPLIEMPKSIKKGAHAHEREDHHHPSSVHSNSPSFNCYGCGGGEPAAVSRKFGVPTGGGAENSACASKLLWTCVLT